MKDKLIALTEGKDFEKLKNYFIHIIRKMAREKNLEDFLRQRVGDDYAEEVFNTFLLKLKIIEDSIKDKKEINTLYVKKNYTFLYRGCSKLFKTSDRSFYQ